MISNLFLFISLNNFKNFANELLSDGNQKQSTTICFIVNVKFEIKENCIANYENHVANVFKSVVFLKVVL